MMMRRIAPLSLCLAASIIVTAFIHSGFSQAPGATPTPVPPGRAPQWRCTMPGGTYVVGLRSVVSVSTHEYLVDAAARVTELNIDTMGNSLVRFYYIEPAVPQTPIAAGQVALQHAQEAVQQLATRTGTEEIWKKVSKSYPTTTHAHTVEYRVDSKEELQKIFQSVDGAFREMKDTEFKVQ